jgi:uncharacterized protein
MNKEIQKISLIIIPILKKHGVKKSSIFGSFARGEEKENSDIDILVELKKGKTLLDLLRLERQLEKKLGRRVDLLTYNSINHLVKKELLKDEIKIYD